MAERGRQHITTTPRISDERTRHRQDAAYGVRLRDGHRVGPPDAFGDVGEAALGHGAVHFTGESGETDDAPGMDDEIYIGVRLWFAKNRFWRWVSALQLPPAEAADLPGPVVADALGYHDRTTSRLIREAGGTWSRYAAGDHTRSPAGWIPRGTSDS
ncbi:hypothetical protein [Streptomyces niveus]|uniref:hypothetical protein n=1 Tax=Streptomyces niveus TaxID=193462 RepID=UPI0036D219E3